MNKYIRMQFIGTDTDADAYIAKYMRVLCLNFGILFEKYDLVRDAAKIENVYEIYTLPVIRIVQEIGGRDIVHCEISYNHLQNTEDWLYNTLVPV